MGAALICGARTAGATERRSAGMGATARLVGARATLGAVLARQSIGAERGGHVRRRRAAGNPTSAPSGAVRVIPPLSALHGAAHGRSREGSVGLCRRRTH